MSANLSFIEVVFCLESTFKFLNILKKAIGNFCNIILRTRLPKLYKFLISYDTKKKTKDFIFDLRIPLFREEVPRYSRERLPHNVILMVAPSCLFVPLSSWRILVS